MITRISLRDFRGFPGPDKYSIDLDQGRNLLLYGENGSGKSSLYEALKGLFRYREPMTFGAGHANVFTGADDGFVSVTLQGAVHQEYRWVHGELPSGDASQAPYLDIARRAVFLDYRDLLKTHLIHRDASRINLFDLLVDGLLDDVDGGDGRTLAEHWQALQNVRGVVPPAEDGQEGDGPPRSRFDIITSAAEEFRNRLDAILHSATENQPCLLDMANVFLKQLDPELRVGLKVGPSLCPPKSRFTWKGRFARREVRLEATYAAHTPGHPALFLNEARLTAIALSLFLAGARLNRPAAVSGQAPKLLILDDVLIGLDLAHRIPLLKLIQREFQDWQVFVLTHDLVWFEMARRQIDGSKWATCELFCEHRVGERFERPVLRQGGANGFLQRAREHLRAGEKRAAAVYARAAFEEKIRSFCSEKGVRLPFKDNPCELDGEEFLQAAEGRIKSRGLWKLLGDQFHRLRMVRKVILNPLSHSNLVNALTPEIADAIEAVEGFQLAAPDAHPSRIECRNLLHSALTAAISPVAMSAGEATASISEGQIERAIEYITSMSLSQQPDRSALERARTLSQEQDTPGNKLEMAVLLRTAFEDSLFSFVRRKRCPLPYSPSREDVSTADLWKVAKAHQKLQSPAVQPFVTAVDSPEFGIILLSDQLDPDRIEALSWAVLRAVLHTLEAAEPGVSYSFQTKLDRLAK